MKIIDPFHWTQTNYNEESKKKGKKLMEEMRNKENLSAILLPGGVGAVCFKT